VLRKKYLKLKPRYDLMLLRVKGRIEFNEYVRPICLDRTRFKPGTRCVVTGWGSTTNATGDVIHSNYLHQVRNQGAERTTRPPVKGPKGPLSFAGTSHSSEGALVRRVTGPKRHSGPKWHWSGFHCLGTGAGTLARGKRDPTLWKSVWTRDHCGGWGFTPVHVSNLAIL